MERIAIALEKIAEVLVIWFNTEKSYEIDHIPEEHRDDTK